MLSTLLSAANLKADVIQPIAKVLKDVGFDLPSLSKVGNAD